MYRAVAHLGVGALLMLLCMDRAVPQDPSLKPRYGFVKLKAGFQPDPHSIKLTAGGPIKTTLGGVSAYVANAPDFRINYIKGDYSLTFYVRSKADTTLLINLPSGKWVANDDGGKGLDPRIHIAQPESGRYDIYVGTYEKDNAPATLHISEVK